MLVRNKQKKITRIIIKEYKYINKKITFLYTIMSLTCFLCLVPVFAAVLESLFRTFFGKKDYETLD